MLKSLAPNASLIVEVGSYHGKSARFLADNSTCPIICIDHWLGSAEHLEDKRDHYQTFLASCWEYQNRITPVRLCSVSGFHVLKNLSLEPDLIYLDGGHDYEQVTADLLCIERLFPNAVVIADDTGWEGVAGAIKDRGWIVLEGGRLLRKGENP
jgi:predicted O-methyltransferase YrrM